MKNVSTKKSEDCQHNFVRTKGAPKGWTKKTPKATERINIRLTEEYRSKLEQLTEHEGTTITKLFMKLIDERMKEIA